MGTRRYWKQTLWKATNQFSIYITCLWISLSLQNWISFTNKYDLCFRVFRLQLLLGIAQNYGNILNFNLPNLPFQNKHNPTSMKKVSVMTGVTTGELMEFECKYGVNLPCNVILTNVTVGAVVAVYRVSFIQHRL